MNYRIAGIITVTVMLLYSIISYAIVSESQAQAVADLPTDVLPPEELWYTFASAWKDAGKVYYSGGFTSGREAYADHLKRGKLALDIATGGELRVLRAPDYNGEIVEWRATYGTMGDEEIGNYVKLTHDDVSWIIGHVFASSGQRKVTTGEAFGYSGGCVGMKAMENQGVTNGCHVHLEFYENKIITIYSPDKPVYTDIEKEPEQAVEPETVVQNSGEYLGKFKVTTYYAPMEGQSDYYLGSYHADKSMNCGPGDCLTTASGYQLTGSDMYKIVACPKNMPFGTELQIEGMPHTVRCEDVGGAINGNRLDLWVGMGDSAWIGKYSGNSLDVWKII